MAHSITSKDMIPRTAYSLFAVNIPHLRGKELSLAIKNYLVGIYPDSLEDRTIAIKKNGHEKWSYLVFILGAGDGKTLAPSSTLFMAYYFAGKDANALYVYNNWAEFVLFEKGAVVKSVVKLRDDIDFLETAHEIFGPAITRLDVFCQQGDTGFFKESRLPFTVTTHHIDKELNGISAYKIAIFDRLSPEKRRLQLLIALLIISTVVGGIMALRERQRSLQDEAARTRQLQEKQELQSEAEKRERLLLAELQQQYRILMENKKAGPYEVAEAIAYSLDDRSGIISNTIRDGFFQMEVNAPDALEILKAFEDNRRIRSPMLQQIHPLNAADRFTISGTVMPELETLDQDIPVTEQISLLRERIREYENGWAKSKGSPSDFGVNIRSLVLKWGCRIDSYQYLNTEGGEEIEFSVQAPGSRFFAFLQEASRNNNGWIFTLVQIRNLAPQNALDVVFRVRAETVIDDALEPLPGIGLSEGDEPVPVSRISRNYYAAAAPASAPRPAAAPAPSQAPPSPRMEQARWLEYVGLISDTNGRQYIYVKNTQTGAMIKLLESGEGDMRYRALPSGNFEARMDGKIYEIRRQ